MHILTNYNYNNYSLEGDGGGCGGGRYSGHRALEAAGSLGAEGADSRVPPREHIQYQMQESRAYRAFFCRGGIIFL